MPSGLTSVPGIEVGHWSGPHTGCTVVVLPEPNIVAYEVRGAAPGSRETDLLAPGMRIEQAQAILLTGGSAFGLSAADGVMAALEADGRGHPTPRGPVPIVPAAVIFDLVPGEMRPGPEQGAHAYATASPGPVEMGRVGAGVGATVAKWRGFEHMVPGGLGSAAVKRGDAVVAALAVVNAVGDAFTLKGEPLTGGEPVPGPPGLFPKDGQNTTLAVVATDVGLSRSQLTRLAIRGQDAYAVCLRPSHTRYDGDAVFAVSCGSRVADVDVVAEAAFEAVGRAIEAALAASSNIL